MRERYRTKSKDIFLHTFNMVNHCFCGFVRIKIILSFTSSWTSITGHTCKTVDSITIKRWRVSVSFQRIIYWALLPWFLHLRSSYHLAHPQMWQSKINQQSFFLIGNRRPTLFFFSHRPNFFELKNLNRFSHHVWKARQVSIVMVSFNTITGQMIEMPQRKKNTPHIISLEIIFY